MHFAGKKSGKFLEQRAKAYLFVYYRMQIVDCHAALLHAVAVANGNSSVFEALVVYGDAERRTDGILTAVAFADAVLFVILDVEVEFEHVDDFAGLLGQTVFFHERQYGGLYGGNWSGYAENDSVFAVIEFLFTLGSRENL